MRCCEKCFNDVDIKDRIKKIGEKGKCDFCHSNKVYVLDIEKAKEQDDYGENIIEDFEGLLDLYIVYDDVEDIVENDYAQKLSDQLCNNTGIFNLKSNEVSKLLKKLLEKKYLKEKDLFEKLVTPRYLTNGELQKNKGIFKGHLWEEFEDDVKYNNRFHSRMINEAIILQFFDLTTIKIKANSRTFYRARISSNNETISSKNMGAAPRNMATPGRLNASGIGYLYLSERVEVAIAEIKASLNDLCTIAKFENIEDLTVVDLSGIKQVSIFSFEEKDSYLMNYEILKKLDLAMRRISGRNRSEIEYVPTEYMSDLIKSMQGIDGIIYKSTVSEYVQDLVLFNSNKVRQLEDEIESYRVERISYGDGLRKVDN